MSIYPIQSEKLNFEIKRPASDPYYHLDSLAGIRVGRVGWAWRVDGQPYPNPRGDQRCPIPNAGLKGLRPWRLPDSVLQTTLADSGQQCCKGSYFLLYRGFNAKRGKQFLKYIVGIKTSISGPTISHVMYADDIILFSKASKKDVESLVRTLEKYYRWSGQSINRSKLGVFFLKHTQSQSRRSIKGILQVNNLKKEVVYQRVPMFMSRSPSKDFTFLEAKLSGWRSKCISWARIRTLINSMALSISIYTMSTFSIPNKVCNSLNALTRRFWWKLKQHESRFLAWKAWDNLCCPRSDGGLALWFAACWGFKSDEAHLAHPCDIIKVILEPP